jgi:hypothetical protein
VRLRIWLKLKPDAFSALTGISRARLKLLEEEIVELKPKELIVLEGIAVLSEFQFL